MERDAVDKCLGLEAGGTRLIEVARGTVLTARGAPVTVTESPLWQGETLLRPRHRLRTGEALSIDRTGWIILSAQGRAEIVFRSPARRRERDRRPRVLLARLLGWFSFARVKS